MRPISVAIDGPSGAGKSTLARALAARLGYMYVDTGAVYRTVAVAVLDAGADPKDEAAVRAVLPQIRIEIAYDPGSGVQRMVLDGQDVTERIREPEVSLAASAVAAHPPVRAFLLDTQRDLARERDVVMDGRDIGTVVLPDADVKIFLTASVEERARRRARELGERGTPRPYEEVLREMIQRDHDDTHRAIAPLRQAEGAVLVDTTDLDLGQSLDRLERLVRERLTG